jgi:glycosyltransferase involved in cell wall biosynthesis
MIVRDEECFLDDALRSVSGIVDEICIIDTGSTDRTLEIARAHGARVREVAWNDDFSTARNAALEMATRRWIVVLDADERLHADSRAALAAIGRTRPAGRGKWILCRNLTDTHTGSGAMTNALVRVFPNDPRIRYRNTIHEFVTFDGSESGLPSDTTAIELVHHGYLSNVVAERRKGERNLRLSRLAMEGNPRDPFHHYNLGMASLLAGDRDGAIVALDRSRELTRHSPRGFRSNALVVLADLYAEHRGDPQTALSLVAECLEHVPNYSNAHFTHGKILARAGNFHAARDAFGRAIAAGAHDGEHFVVDNEIAIWKAHSEIGATLMFERRYDQALAWFELASQARPAAQALIINRAKCHEALGDLVAAKVLFEAAFTDARDEPSAIEWINFLLRAGNTEDAWAAIEAALPCVGENARVLLLGTSAAMHLQSGDRAGAAAALARASAGGEAQAVSETLTALAVHFGTPELAELLAETTGSRAKCPPFAYVHQS